MSFCIYRLSKATKFCNFCRGLKQNQCNDRMKLAFDNKAPSRSAIYNFLKEFFCCHKHLIDDVRKSQPRSSLTPNTLIVSED